MWSIHNKCNYACSYCPDILHNGDTSWLRMDYLQGFIDRVHDHYVKRLGHKNILFSFTGGEPTLWKDFLPFIEYINSKGFYCGLTSNGSVSINFWERISTYFNYICLSFHPESADPVKFLKTYKFLHDHPQTVIPSVRVMMHPREEMWKKSVNLVKELKKFSNWSYQCVHILNDYGMNSKKIDYGSKDKEDYLLQNSYVKQFHDNNVIHIPQVDFHYGVEYKNLMRETLDENQLINQGLVNFNGWNCNIGLEQLFIIYSGEVYRAGCKVGGVLGDISSYEKINFPITPIKCHLNGCYCPTDTRIPKSAPGQILEYQTTAYSREFKKVGTNSSFFDFRLICTLSEATLKLFGSIIYLSSIGNFITHILQSKKIPREKILLHLDLFQCVDLAQFYESLNLISHLSVPKSLIIPSTKELNKTYCKSISHNFDYITAHVKNLNDLKCAELFVDFVQDEYDTKLNIQLDVSSFEKVDLIAEFLQRCEEKKYYEIAILGNEKKIQNGLDHILKGYRFHGSFEKGAQYHTRNKRLHSYTYDETCIMGYNRLSSLGREGLLKRPYPTKKWLCKKGQSSLTIDPMGRIKTSSCPQAEDVGILFSPETYQELPTHSYQCRQESCQGFFDKLIKKESLDYESS